MTKSKIKKFEGVKITGSNQRAWELLMRIAKRKSFQCDVGKLRKEFDVPNNKLNLHLNKVIFEHFVFPGTWSKNGDLQTLQILHKEVEKLMAKNKADLLTAYPLIFYWIIFYKIYILPDEIGTVVLRDMVQIKKEIKTINLKENYLYPVALLINTYASGEEIKNFVDAHLNRIQMYQNRYKEKTPPKQPIRIREPLNITKFIYSLDGKKTNKEIANLANKKLGSNYYNNDDVSRVLDKKRRKER